MLVCSDCCWSTSCTSRRRDWRSAECWWWRRPRHWWGELCQQMMLLTFETSVFLFMPSPGRGRQEWPRETRVAEWGQSGRGTHYVLTVPVYPFVASVTKLVKMMFGKQMNRFQCRLAWVDSGLQGSIMKRSTFGVRSSKIHDNKIGGKNPFGQISQTMRRILAKCGMHVCTMTLFLHPKIIITPT